MRVQRVVASLVTAGLFLVGVALPVPHAALAANSHSFAECLHDGYVQLETDSGGTFESAQSCMAYAKAGGGLWQPTVTIEDVGTYSANGSEGWYVEYSATGFHPNSTGTEYAYFPDTPPEYPWVLPTNYDATGSVGDAYWSIDCGPAYVGQPATWKFVDSFGLHAQATAIQPC
jgi:hypothetical protein